MRIDAPQLQGTTTCEGDLNVTGNIIDAALKTSLDGYQTKIDALNVAADGYLYTNPNATTLNALVTAAGVSIKTIVISTHLTLGTSSVTVPSNVDLMFIDNGHITVGSGETLTINNGLPAELKHIFILTDATSIINLTVGDVYPQWFGAKGDGINDDTLAIQQALNATKSASDVEITKSGTVWLSRGIYMVSSPLQFYTGNSLFGTNDGTIVSTSPGFSGTAIIEMAGGSHHQCVQSNIKNLTFYSTNASVWAIKATAASVVNCTIENITLDAYWGLSFDTYLQSTKISNVLSLGYLNQLLVVEGNNNIFEKLDKEGDTGTSSDPYIYLHDSWSNYFENTLIEGNTSTNKIAISCYHSWQITFNNLWIECPGGLFDGYALKLNECSPFLITGSSVFPTPTAKNISVINGSSGIIENLIYDENALYDVLKIDSTSKCTVTSQWGTVTDTPISGSVNSSLTLNGGPGNNSIFFQPSGTGNCIFEANGNGAAALYAYRSGQYYFAIVSSDPSGNANVKAKDGLDLYLNPNSGGKVYLGNDLYMGGHAINDGYFAGSPAIYANGNVTVSGTISSPGTGSLSEHFGSGSVATQFGATAIGNSASAGNAYATAIGYLSLANSYGATADGYASHAAQSSAAVGHISAATGSYATAMGYNARATADNSTAIGVNSNAYGLYSVALGAQSAAQEYAAIAIGMNADTQFSNGVAIGNGAYSSGNAVGVGTSALAGANSVSVGPNSTADAQYATVVGPSASSTAQYTVAIGYNASTTGTNSIVIGANATTDGYANALAIGVGSSATGNNKGEIGSATTPISLKLYSDLTVGGNIINTALKAALDGYGGNAIINVNASAGTLIPVIPSYLVFNITLDADLIIANPTGTIAKGHSITFQFEQDSIGYHNITSWGAAYKGVDKFVARQGPSQASWMLFVSNGDATFTLVAMDGIDLTQPLNVHDFGALGDGSHDDTAAIQAAILITLYGSRKPKVYLPAGIYKTTDTLHLGYGHKPEQSGGQPGHSVVLEGDTYNYDPNDIYLSGTAIVPTFSDRQAISVQGCMGAIIKGISIIGLLGNWITSHSFCDVNNPPTIDDTIESNWNDPSLDQYQDSQYAPYAAITIDAFCGTQPAIHYPDITFPPITEINFQYGKRQSEDVLIENVYIRGFNTGIVVQPCTYDGNGDFTCIKHCWLEQCKYGISAGNSQSRNIEVQDVKLSFFYYGLINCKHGTRRGKFCGTIDNLSVYMGINLFNFGYMYFGGPLTFLNAYSESLWKLGVAGSDGVNAFPLVFQTCQFSFNLQDGYYRGAPTRILDGPNGYPMNIKFIGCGLTDFQSVIGFDTQVSFDSTYIWPLMDSPPGGVEKQYPLYLCHAHNALCGGIIMPGFGYTGTDSVRYIVYDTDDGYTLDHGFLSAITGSGFSAASRKVCCPLLVRTITAWDDLSPDNFFITHETDELDISSFLSCTLVDKTLAFSYTSAALYELPRTVLGPGDILLDQNSGSTFFVRSRTDSLGVTTIIAELQNNYKWDGDDGYTTIDPFSTTSGLIYIGLSRIYTPSRSLLGDVVAGSNVINNCGRGDGWFGFGGDIVPGDWLLIYSYRDSLFNTISDTQVSNVDNTERTITLAGNANYTNLRKQIQAWVKQPPPNV